MSNAFDDVNGYQEKISVSAFIWLCFAPPPTIFFNFKLASCGTGKKVTVANTQPRNVVWEVGAVNSDKYRAV